MYHRGIFRSFENVHHQKVFALFFLTVLIALPVVFLSDMGQMRFSLAIAIILLSIPYCLNRDPIRFGLIVFAASVIHVSALIFAIAYFLPKAP
jgi:hypothetical protein